MNTQQQYLQILFNGYVFAGNDSALASVLGYGRNSRSTIGRIKRGEGVSPETAAEIWEKLREEFFLSDSDIATTAKCVARGRDLYKALQAVYGVGNEWHARAFGALVTGDYASISPQFEKELSPSFNEMKLQEPELYYGMLACCYIMCKGITPYTSSGMRVLHKQLRGLDDMLFTIFPANSRARQAAEKVVSYELADEHLTLLKLIYNVRVIFGNYIDEEYFENYMRENGHLLGVGDDSYWFVPGTSFGSGCELWYFSVVPTKSPLRGSYIAMRLRACAGEALTFSLAESYSFMFLIAADKDATRVLQAYDLPSGRIAFASYSYDSDTRRLKLVFPEELDNVFSLPTELQCVNCESPQGAEERVWKSIIEKQIEERCGEYILEAVNSSGESDFEYLSDYEIDNVSIDRKNVTVAVEHNGRETLYSLPLASHPFLSKITPAEFVGVARSKSTGELFICWNNMGQYIPVKEFKVLG